MDRNRTRLWDFPSAAILVLALLTVSERLYVTTWTAGLVTVPILTLIGVVVGLALGASRFSRKIVFVLAVGYSIPVIVLVVGRTLYAGTPWLESLINLAGRLARSVGLFMTAQPVKDTALFIAFLSISFWTISLVAGYAAARSGNFFGAVAPAGMALVIIQLYDLGNPVHDALLGVYFFFCLLLFGRMAYARNRLFWKEQRIALLAESRTELNLILVAAAISLVVLAWLTPSLGHTFSAARNFWGDLTRSFREIQEDLGHAVAGIDSGQGTRPVISYGDSFSLGQQAITGTSVYMTVLSSNNQGAGRYYWRVRNYNVYLDGKWYTEGFDSQSFTPGQDPISLPDSEGFVGRFSFTSEESDLSELVTPARPEWVSRPSELIYFDTQLGALDPVVFRLETPVLAGESYVVQAKTYSPTVVQLRSAGDNYPAWVMEHYTQLPDDLPVEIINLAQQITIRTTNPYDMASAITVYLRSRMTYSTTVQPPPEGLDPIAWFLFDTKTGFCNYYATSEVILLRSVGIPARLVVGFAQGEVESPNRYTILQSDAHAWPEAYFPGIGWVEFEPTVSQPPLTRPLGVSVTPGTETVTPQPNGTGEPGIPGGGTPTPQASSGAGSGPGTRAGLIVQTVLAGLLVVVAVLTILLISPYGVFDKILVRPRSVFQHSLPVLLKRLLVKLSLTPPGWLERWAYFAGLNPVGRAFAVVYRSLHWLGVKTSPAQTPAQAAAVLAERLPEASSEIHSLLQEYQRSLYSRETGNLYKARNANRVVRRATLRTILRRYWRT